MSLFLALVILSCYVNGFNTSDTEIVDLATEPTKSVTCYNGWQMYQQQCYKVFLTPKSWNDSLETCKQGNGNLVSMQNIGQLAWVTSLLTEVPKGGFWIGLRFINSTFKWSDGKDLRILHWSSKMRRKKPLDGIDCAYIESDNEEDPGYWSLSECEQKKSYVCLTQQTQARIQSTTATPGCGQNMVGWNNRCYWTHDEPVTMNSGATECQNKGGHLVDFEDISELYFVTSMVYEKQIKYWTGLYVNQTTNVFQWSSGKQLMLSTRQIGLIGKDLSTGNCTSITVKGGRHQMEVLRCTDQLPVICEKFKDGYITEQKVTTIGLLRCPPGWYYSAPVDKCFWNANGNQLRWTDANNYCKMFGGNLVTTATSYAHRSVHDFCKRSGITRLWLGLMISQNGTGIQAKWSDGTMVLNDRWYHEVPSFYKSKICIFLRVYRSRLRAKPADCRSRNIFICEKKPFMEHTNHPVPTESPLVKCAGGQQDWYFFNGFCYYTSSNLNRLLNWTDSRRYCRDSGGDLLSIHNDLENDYIMKLFRYTKVSEEYRYWIGLNAIELNTPYSWSDGSPLNYITMDSKELGSNKDTHRCFVISAEKGTWQRVQDCNRLRTFVCKKLYAPTEHTFEKNTDEFYGDCKSGWTDVGEKCFKLFTNRRQNWYQALDNCRNFGPTYDLASIHNNVELTLASTLMDTIHNPAWIGFNDKGTHHQFFWSDMSAVSFTFWGVNEPNNWRGRGEDCVEMKSGLHKFVWNDTPCSDRIFYLCQYYKNPLDPRIASISGNSSIFTYGNNTYHLFFHNKLPWNEAQEACEQIGANLVSFQSEIESIFVHLMLTKRAIPNIPYWIGLRQNDKKRLVTWSDGGDLNYTSWHGNNYGFEKNCVTSDRNVYWKLRSCTQKYNYICKISDSLLSPGNKAYNGNNATNNVTKTLNVTDAPTLDAKKVTAEKVTAGAVIGYLVLTIVICLLLAAAVIYGHRRYRNDKARREANELCVKLTTHNDIFSPDKIMET